MIDIKCNIGNDSLRGNTIIISFSIHSAWFATFVKVLNLTHFNELYHFHQLT